MVTLLNFVGQIRDLEVYLVQSNGVFGSETVKWNGVESKRIRESSYLKTSKSRQGWKKLGSSRSKARNSSLSLHPSGASIFQVHWTLFAYFCGKFGLLMITLAMGFFSLIPRYVSSDLFDPRATQTAKTSYKSKEKSKSWLM